MCRNRLLIEAIGLTRQFDLAVQGLVRNAEQRAVGHTEAIALGRDRGRFHVNRHRPALRETQRAVRKAQFPVAIVRGDHGAGAHAPLQRIAVDVQHLLCRFRQGLLYFRDRGDRYFRGQHIVQDMIVAQIGMGEHEIADPLGRTQTAAMADHEKSLGPKHGQMIGDRLCIRWPDPDIDEADPAAVFRDQMIGRHLVAPPGAVGDQIGGLVMRLVDHQPAGTR